MSDLYKFGYTLDETIKTMRDVIDTGNYDRMFLDTYHWLKMLSEYREIGIVEDCREAFEKQKPKKPKLNYKSKFFGKATYTCPKCGNACLEKFANERQNNNYCWDCGQKIDFGGCV